MGLLSTYQSLVGITPRSAADNFGRFMRDNGSAATAHKAHKVDRRPAAHC